MLPQKPQRRMEKSCWLHEYFIIDRNKRRKFFVGTWSNQEVIERQKSFAILSVNSVAERAFFLSLCGKALR